MISAKEQCVLSMEKKPRKETCGRYFRWEREEMPQDHRKYPKASEYCRAENVLEKMERH